MAEIHPDGAISRVAIANSLERIRRYVRHTPILHADLADFGLPSGDVAFKLEFTQRAGSFKIRGAFANLLRQPTPAAGVVAASGGNHGVAVAYAAKVLGVPARIFVPSISTLAKRQAIERHGATLVVSGDRYENALAASQVYAQETGARTIHAYDEVGTLLGQGTIGAEIEAAVPDLDTLFVAVGGGGLIGGIAAWYEGRVRIIAVEPEESPTLRDALAAGGPVDAPAGGIAADSLAPRQVGKLMFPIARSFVAATCLVSDDHIRAAQEHLWRELRIVTEPGGATAFAPLLSGGYRPEPGERIGVLLCGANTDAVNLR